MRFKNPQILERVNYVTQLFAKGIDRRSIVAECSGIWGVGEKAIGLYITEARKQIAEKGKELEKREQERLAKQAEINALRKLTIEEKYDILHRIANGTLETEKIVYTKEGYKKVKTLPDHQDMMKAIEIDNKMSGHNAPDKQQVEFAGISIIFEKALHERSQG